MSKRIEHRNADGELHCVDGPAVIERDGTEEWWVDGQRHRDDGPAIIRPDGSKSWFRDGQLHRDDGPAVIAPDRQSWWLNGQPHRDDGPATIDDGGAESGGSEEWFRHGELHREDGPAVIIAGGADNGGSETWYRNGKRHREDGPADIDGANEQWWLNGKLHREDGPASISRGGEYWYRHGLRHREDGPAVIDGDYQSWWLNGQRVEPFEVQQDQEDHPEAEVLAQRRGDNDPGSSGQSVGVGEGVVVEPELVAEIVARGTTEHGMLFASDCVSVCMGSAFVSSFPGTIGMSCGSKYAHVTMTVQRWTGRPPITVDDWEDVDEVPFISSEGSGPLWVWGFDAPGGEPTLDLDGLGLSVARVCAAHRQMEFEPGGDMKDTDEEWLVQIWPDETAAASPMTLGPRRLNSPRPVTAYMEEHARDDEVTPTHQNLFSEEVADITHLLRWSPGESLHVSVRSLAQRLDIYELQVVGAIHALVARGVLTADVDVRLVDSHDLIRLGFARNSDASSATVDPVTVDAVGAIDGEGGQYRRFGREVLEYGGGVDNGGGEEWRVDGKRHRDEGLPAFVRDGGVANGGSEEWWRDGKLHREDGPAAVYDGGVANGGSEMWWRDGKTHREDGPAVIRLDREEWWLNGEQIPAPNDPT